jgi:hypothetical protein
MIIDHLFNSNLTESKSGLQVGDPVVITGNVQFQGKTGDVVDIGRDGAFVVVDLYNHGRKSFHSSDVSHNDYAGSDDEQEYQQRVAEGDLDKFKKYTRPVVKTTPKIERTTNPSGRTTDHVEWIVTSDTGEKRRFTSKKSAQEYYNMCTKRGVAEGNLQEFAPGDGNSGRWYSDDDLADIVGEDWYEFDVSHEMGNIGTQGERARIFLAREAEAYLNDRGYNVNVLDVRDQGDNLSWYISGSLMNEQGVAEGSAQELSIQQLATISDEALDNAYGYGRSSPGNSFGWQANLMSAAYAKKMIDAGVTDIEKIADAIHKGWNITASKFVQNPDQFGDTEKLKQAGKLDAKLQQRAKLMKINYANLDNEEQEKDRVVARALLQAMKGQQGVAEGSLNPKARAKAQMLKMYGDGQITFRKTSNGGYFIQHEDNFGDTNSHQYDPATGKVDFSGVTRSSYHGYSEGVTEGSFKQTPGQRQYGALHSQLQSLANSGQINTPVGKQKAEKMIDTIQQLVDTDPSCAGSTVPSKKIWLSEQGMAEGSAQEKLYKRHQELRKKSGLPDAEYYQELKQTYTLPDEERYAKQAEIKKRYGVKEQRTQCPECGGAAYEDRVLAEKQDACYHKVRSRYKVWPSAYASGALVQCRKKGAANWGNKSKK